MENKNICGGKSSFDPSFNIFTQFQDDNLDKAFEDHRKQSFSHRNFLMYISAATAGFFAILFSVDAMSGMFLTSLTLNAVVSLFPAWLACVNMLVRRSRSVTTFPSSHVDPNRGMNHWMILSFAVFQTLSVGLWIIGRCVSVVDCNGEGNGWKSLGCNNPAGGTNHWFPSDGVLVLIAVLAANRAILKLKTLPLLICWLVGIICVCVALALSRAWASGGISLTMMVLKLCLLLVEERSSALAFVELEAARSRAARLQEGLDTKKLLVRYIAHEVRSPLNIVHGGLEMVLAEACDRNVGAKPSWIEQLMDIFESSGVAVNTLNDFLQFENMDAGMFNLEMAEMPVSKLVSKRLKPYIVLAKQRNLRFKIENKVVLDPSKMAMIRVDEFRIDQVIRNMVTNAMKFTPSGGTVTVKIFVHRSALVGTTDPSDVSTTDPTRARKHSCSVVPIVPLVPTPSQSNLFGSWLQTSPPCMDEPDPAPELQPQPHSQPHQLLPQAETQDKEDEVFAGKGDEILGPSVVQERSHILRIAVVDTGPGIAPENHDKVFGQFAQFNRNELQGGGGSGLGLWISRQIAEMHGGSMGFSSEGLGKGCTFFVDLPLYLVDADEEMQNLCPLGSHQEQQYQDEVEGVEGRELILPLLPHNTSAGPVAATATDARGEGEADHVFQCIGGQAVVGPWRPPLGLVRSISRSLSFGSNISGFVDAGPGVASSSLHEAAARNGSSPRLDLLSGLGSGLVSGLGSGLVRNADSDVALAPQSSLGIADIGNTQNPIQHTSHNASHIQTFSTPQSSLQGNWRVLIVDDSKMNRKFIRRILDSSTMLKGADFMEVDDGSTAVELIKSERDIAAVAEAAGEGEGGLLLDFEMNEVPVRVSCGGAHGVAVRGFDFVFLDRQMNVMHGPEAASIMRTELGYQGIIIGVTGYDSPADVASFKAAGVDEVLAKPITGARADALVRGLVAAMRTSGC